VGQSALTPVPYTIADLADDAAGLLAALGVPSAHVVGWSMGGAVAQELALRHPERVRGLVLIATYTSSDPRGAVRQRSWALLRERLSLQEYADATWPWVYTVHDYRTPGLIEGAFQRMLETPAPQPNEAYRRQVEAVLSHHTEGRLGGIGVPTLLIFGEEDLLTPLRFARVLAAEVPNARLVTIPRAGHALLWTHGELVTMLLRGWLEEVAA
jgi:3-oxoadipate enol-lactonase